MRTDVGKPKRPLGTFGEDLKKSSKSRWALPALAAAAVAAVGGFGAYLISASAGLNEPPVVAAVQSSDLGLEARALEQAAGGLSPHRFSHAWGSARKVTDGRITGLAASRVDGTPALLVYTKSDGSTLVTVVTGCASDTLSPAHPPTLPLGPALPLNPPMARPPAAVNGSAVFGIGCLPRPFCEGRVAAH